MVNMVKKKFKHKTLKMQFSNLQSLKFGKPSVRGVS